MPLTYQDLLERLKQLDEVSLMEILEVNSDMIVDRFQDNIEERLDYLVSEFEDEQDEQLPQE